LVERKIPSPEVPAKRYVPETVRERTLVFVKPVLTCVQLVPLLVERNTPSPVPANRDVPEMAKASTAVPGMPLLDSIQLVPLLVETKTPLPVPARSSLP
jgi:hypothetical protein